MLITQSSACCSIIATGKYLLYTEHDNSLAVIEFGLDLLATTMVLTELILPCVSGIWKLKSSNESNEAARLWDVSV